MNLDDYWKSFIPLFVAVDAIGVLPLYLGLVEGASADRLRRILWQSVFTAGAVAITFLFIGDFLLRALGITVNDFMVAGGALLFIIALSDLLSGTKRQRENDPDTVGAVPIGVPLITGPAVLTTCLLLKGQHGTLPTLVSLLANIGLAGVTFAFAFPIRTCLGNHGMRTVSKIASLLLAAIAVMLMRKGLENIIQARMTAPLATIHQPAP